MNEQLPVFSNWELIVAVFTYFSPNIIALIQQPSWPTWLRKAVFFAFHLLTAIVYLGAAGKLTGATLAIAFPLIFTYGLASYIGIWKPTADMLEIKSSPKRSLSKIRQLPNKSRDIMDNGVIS